MKNKVDRTPNYKWNVKNNILTYSHGKKIIFRDSMHHWINGVCRLLNISDKEGRQWVEKIAVYAFQKYGKHFYKLANKEKLAVMKAASKAFFGIEKGNNTDIINKVIKVGPCDHKADVIWGDGIGENNSFAVAGCKKCQHGWLIDVKNPQRAQIDTVSYEEEYFEGTRKGIGYRGYLEQQEWRIEKSHRLIKQIKEICKQSGLDIKKAIFLDIGSGYGFFRKALDYYGWHHEGIELSAYAADICKKEFGFATYVGSIEDFCKEAGKQYDIITIWDVLEHLSSPLTMLRIVCDMLTDNGICAIRTPNLMSIEREVLGRFYYSIKKEHLNYFSPRSIRLFLKKVKLYPHFLITESHIFSGFLSEDMHLYEKMLKGSDIFLVASKKTEGGS